MYILQKLEELLIYGAYPDVLKASSADDKKEYLISIRDSYFLKDILELERFKNPSKLRDLLKLLVFQIGQEVSLNELSTSLGIAKQSVERYLDLHEKPSLSKKLAVFQ